MTAGFAVGVAGTTAGEAGGEEDFEGVAVLDDQDDAAQSEGDGSGSGPNDGAHGLDAEVDVSSEEGLGDEVAPVVQDPLGPGDGSQGKSIVAFHNGAPSLFSTAATAPISTVFHANGTALWVAAYGPADNGTQGSIAVLHGTSNPTATPAAVVTGQPFNGGVIPDSAGP